MKRILSVAMVLAMLLCTLVLPALAETKTYPDGVLQWWSTGQPEFRKQYFDTWLEAHRDIAPGVSIEATAISTTNDSPCTTSRATMRLCPRFCSWTPSALSTWP